MSTRLWLRVLWNDVALAWHFLPTWWQARLEALAWGIGCASGSVLWEAYWHGGITGHTWALAAGAAVLVFKAALRQLPRDVWTESQRKNGGAK
jgi:hypothetical protein